jgi:hypothetical protein
MAVVAGVWRRDVSTPSTRVAATVEAPTAKDPIAEPRRSLEQPTPTRATLSAAPRAVEDPTAGEVPRASAPHLAGDRTAAGDGNGASDPAPVPSSGEEEIDVLRRAQQALPAHPAEALAAAEEHRRRFPSGGLAQEREVIVVSALAALGRRDEARSRARRFVETYPGSAHRVGIEALVRDPPSERSDQNGRSERSPNP